MAAGKNEDEHIKNILQYQAISEKIKNLLQDSARLAEAIKKLQRVHAIAKGRYDRSMYYLMTDKVLPKINKNKPIYPQIYSILKQYCNTTLPSKTSQDKRKIEQILAKLVPHIAEGVKGRLFLETSRNHKKSHAPPAAGMLDRHRVASLDLPALLSKKWRADKSRRVRGLGGAEDGAKVGKEGRNVYGANRSENLFDSAGGGIDQRKREKDKLYT